MAFKADSGKAARTRRRKLSELAAPSSSTPLMLRTSSLSAILMLAPSLHDLLLQRAGRFRHFLRRMPPQQRGGDGSQKNRAVQPPVRFHRVIAGVSARFIAKRLGAAERIGQRNQPNQIGRAHVLTPVTATSRMPSS